MMHILHFLHRSDVFIVINISIPIIKQTNLLELRIKLKLKQTITIKTVNTKIVLIAKGPSH